MSKRLFYLLQGTTYLLASLVAPILFITDSSLALGADGPDVIYSTTNGHDGPYQEISAPSQISDNGRYVAYVILNYNHNNGVSLLLTDRSTNSTHVVYEFDSESGGFGGFKLSGDGSTVAFTTGVPIDSRADSAGAQTYVISTQPNSAPRLVSIDDQGQLYAFDRPGLQAQNFAISSDGSKVLWRTYDYNSQLGKICVTTVSTGSVDCPIDNVKYLFESFWNGHYIFYKDAATNTLRRYNLTDQNDIPVDLGSAISPDGEYSVDVIRDNNSNNYHITGFTKIEIATGEHQDISINQNELATKSWFTGPQFMQISGDNSTVLFQGQLHDVLYQGGGNQAEEVFSYNFNTNNLEPVSINSWGNYSNMGGYIGIAGSTLTYDGSLATFYTFDSNLVNSEARYRVYVNSTEGTTNGLVDNTNPVASDVLPDGATKDIAQTLNFSANVSDDNSGVVAGEFYLSDNNAVTPARAVYGKAAHRIILASYNFSKHPILFASSTTNTIIGYPGQVPGAGTPMEYSNGHLYGVIGSDVPDGSYTIRVRAQDAAGNWSDEAFAQLTVTGGEPQLLVPSPPSGLTVTTPTNQAPVLNWNTSYDPSRPPVISYNIYRNGVNVGSTTSTSYTDSTLAEGVYTYYVTAVNSDGESMSSDGVNAVVDKTRPIVAVSSPSTLGGTYSTGPTISVTASDSGSGLKQLVIHVYKSNGTLLNTCGTANASQLAAGSQSCSLASLPNGSYYIKTGAFDNAGNNKTVTTATFTISH